MTTLDIPKKVYKEWSNYYKKQDNLKFPTLKNFTARKLKEIMEKETYKDV